MGSTIAQKLIKSHLLSGDMTVGSEIGLRIDQTLTQDATGTMAYLEFEAMGVERVKTELSVAYIDHNTLQTGFENADDHRFIRSAAKKRGLLFSRPGNGICHQVHLERFGIPGKTLIGSDSHTPTGGGIGMLSFGAGGLDVAVAMGGGAYYITMPKMTRINLHGALSPWVSAKDIILEVLRIMSVKGGVGKIIEYGGDGVKTLSVPERAEEVDFALPYMNVALGVISPDSNVITSLDNWNADDQMIVISGTTAETYLTKEYPDIPLQKYDSYATAKNALENGNGVAWANDNTEVIAFAKQNSGYTVGIPSLGSQDTIAPAVSKGNTTLLDWINDEIKSLGEESFFHKDYEETLVDTYGLDYKDELVVEGGETNA